MQARLPALIVVGLALAGCRNSCQQLCHEMADYAVEECGLAFPDEDLKTCVSDHNGGATDRDDLQACSAASDALTEGEWTCDDAKEYFKADGAGGSRVIPGEP